MTKSRVVSVFGSSRPEPDSPDYRQAYALGEALARAGYTIMTGGYGGTMEAASKGAKAAGGHVIGVTVALFEEAGYRTGPNPYNDEIIRYDTLHERLLHLVSRGDAAIALPGGIGTLSEVFLTWSLLQVGEIRRKPFILLGEWWTGIMECVYGDGTYIREEDRSLLRVAYTPDEVIALLREKGV